VYAVAFFYFLLILKTTLAVTLLLARILLLLVALDSNGRLTWVLLGLLLGLLPYLWANLLLMLPLSMLFIFFFIIGLHGVKRLPTVSSY
jgi:hypothetical protein